MSKTDSRVDASLNVNLNGVRLPDGRLVAWAVAFPNVGIHLKGAK